jgi:hypothetical protein
MPPVSSYPIFEQWYKTCDWLLQACDRMPKHTRFTISGRIANVALDITAVLVEAIYSQDKKALLQRLNLLLEQLRILIRLSKDRKHLTLAQYAFISEALNETGKMTGGWLKSLGT